MARQDDIGAVQKGQEVTSLKHRKGGVMLVTKGDDGGIRSLAAQVIRIAVDDYLAGLNPKIPKMVRDHDTGLMRRMSAIEVHPCTRHTATCRCRSCAEDFLFGHRGELPAPLNFVFCCEVLELRPELVREGLRRRLRESTAAVGVS